MGEEKNLSLAGIHAVGIKRMIDAFVEKIDQLEAELAAREAAVTNAEIISLVLAIEQEAQTICSEPGIRTPIGARGMAFLAIQAAKLIRKLNPNLEFTEQESDMVETPKSDRRLITAKNELTDDTVRVFGGEIARPKNVTVEQWRKMWDSIFKMEERKR